MNYELDIKMDCESASPRIFCITITDLDSMTGKATFDSSKIKLFITLLNDYKTEHKRQRYLHYWFKDGGLD